MNYSGKLVDSDGNIFYPKTVTKIVTGKEFETGNIIDGKKEYGKRIECGALPNTTNIMIVTDILANYTLTDYYGIAISQNNASIKFPYAGTDVNGNVGLTIWSNGNTYTIEIFTNRDRRTYSSTFVTVFYTKN